MSKSQRRGNKESRKPKQDKTDPPPIVAGDGSPMRAGENKDLSQKKKK